MGLKITPFAFKHKEFQHVVISLTTPSNCVSSYVLILKSVKKFLNNSETCLTLCGGLQNYSAGASPRLVIMILISKLLTLDLYCKFVPSDDPKEMFHIIFPLQYNRESPVCCVQEETG